MACEQATSLAWKKPTLNLQHRPPMCTWKKFPSGAICWFFYSCISRTTKIQTIIELTKRGPHTKIYGMDDNHYQKQGNENYWHSMFITPWNKLYKG